MMNSRKKHNLAKVSLVLALLAFLGVFPITFLMAGISHSMTGTTSYRMGVPIVFLSLPASILAIILGFISLISSEKRSSTRKFAGASIALGILIWPCIILTWIFQQS